MSATPARRLFFALWPDEVLRQRIVAQTRDSVAASRGRPTAISNLHITVLFLGEVPEDRLAVVRAAGAHVNAESFGLEFDAVEAWRRSGVLSLTARETPPALLDLVEQLRFKLLEAQFNLRPEEYRPHVTLARRILRRNERRAIAAVRWHVSDFALVESRSGLGGSTYSVLESWPLGEKSQKGGRSPITV
jgi:2'-5' RNA ligase